MFFSQQNVLILACYMKWWVEDSSFSFHVLQCLENLQLCRQCQLQPLSQFTPEFIARNHQQYHFRNKIWHRMALRG